MLETQRVVEHQRRHPGSTDHQLDVLRAEEQVAARRNEAQTLEAFHREPLPPGYTVIFTIDDRGRAIYALRVPPGEDEPKLVAEDIRVVLAEAWNCYYTRLPDGLDSDAFERLVQQPPEPRSYLWRTFWEMALHHVAYCEVTYLFSFVGQRPGGSQQDAMTTVLRDFQTASGSLEARRAGRLAYLLGLWDDEDPERASLMFLEDPQVVLPWISLFGRYLNRVDPAAARWWDQLGCKSMKLPTSAKEAERRMASATSKAWATTYLVAMACAAEFAREPPSPPELATQALNEGVHTGGRIEALGLLPRSGMDYNDVMRWAHRLLRKNSPRLLKILGRHFPYLGTKTQSLI